jgi:hypothetical protein
MCISNMDLRSTHGVHWLCRLYRIFYGENTAAALTCTPQHNRDSVMIKHVMSQYKAFSLIG